MSNSELKTFTHDLLHDLASWQELVGEYQRDLQPQYRYDSLAAGAAAEAIRVSQGIGQYAAGIAADETLVNDLALLTHLDSFDSALQGFPDVCFGSEDSKLASPGLTERSVQFEKDVVRIQKQLHAYDERFYAHVLIRLRFADASLGDVSWWDASQTNERNAEGWKSLGTIARLMFVDDYFVGYLNGSLAGAVLGAGSAQDKQTSKSLNAGALAKLQVEVRDQAHMGKRNWTPGEVEKTISDFYRDPANHDVCWNDAFKFAAMSLNGDSPAPQDLKTARELKTPNSCGRGL